MVKKQNNTVKAYLFLGGDHASKDQKISALKKEIFGSESTLEFDYEVLHGHKLDSDQLKQSLIAFPAITSKRVVLIRECNKISADNKKILVKFLKTDFDHVVLILDSDQLEASSSLAKAVAPYAKVEDLNEGPPINVFDMTRAMSMRRPQEALKILNDLLAGGDHPLQIMGALVWFWGKSKPRMPVTRFKNGLLALQEADLNIKRSRLKAEHAVELVVVKLCSL